MRRLHAFVVQHLKDANWTYFQHLRHALDETWVMAKITFKGLVHGFLPWVWTGYAPVEIYKLYKRMRKLRHNQVRYEEVDREDDANIKK